MVAFDYNKAFSRDIGWVTESEQLLLKDCCISIAGMGGVGGSYAVSLARLGIGHFKIADFDVFETHNFNRQIGAFMSTIGKPKAEVIKNMVLDINPNAHVEVFSEGISADNLQNFLQGSLIYVDGLDFFCLKERELVFKKAYEMHIPAITVAPVGAGSVTLSIHPKKMSFDQLFGLSETEDPLKKQLKFGIGMTFNTRHLKYLGDPNSVDIKNKSVPSLICGIQSATAAMTTEVLKILLNRGKVYWAPYITNYDPFINRYKRSYMWFGKNNPIFLLKNFIANKIIQNSP